MAAQSKDGRFTRAKSRYSQQCQATTADGSQCRAWARRGEPYCYLHGLSEEERKQVSQEAVAAHRRNAARRKAARQANGRKTVPLDTHEQALVRLAEAEDRLRQLVEDGRLDPSLLPRLLPTKPKEPWE